MFLAFDGGGSKLNALMFDEDMHIVATASSGGVNPTQSTVDECVHNATECVDRLFANHAVSRIQRMYSMVIGRGDAVAEAVHRHTQVDSIVGMGEAYACLLSGNLATEGLSLVCGTGATVGYVRERVQRSVGGWGPILGDDGSGPWIGQQAIRAAVRMINGWGEDTLLLNEIRAEWQLQNDWDMVTLVHSSPAPLRKIGSLTRAVGRAVEAGDKVARSIIDEAARRLALQTISAIRKYAIPAQFRQVVLSGGAWKTHRSLPRKYIQKLAEAEPTASACRALFEPVIAGPASELILERGLTRREAFEILNTQMHTYRVNDSEYMEG